MIVNVPSAKVSFAKEGCPLPATESIEHEMMVDHGVTAITNKVRRRRRRRHLRAAPADIWHSCPCRCRFGMGGRQRMCSSMAERGDGAWLGPSRV